MVAPGHVPLMSRAAAELRQPLCSSSSVTRQARVMSYTDASYTMENLV